MATSLQQKQISVLTMNTLAFAVNFAVWTMFSIIGIRIKQQLNLVVLQVVVNLYTAAIGKVLL